MKIFYKLSLKNGNSDSSDTEQTIQLYNYSAILTVIKTYRYIIYVEIFITVNCDTVHIVLKQSKPLCTC